MDYKRSYDMSKLCCCVFYGLSSMWMSIYVYILHSQDTLNITTLRPPWYCKRDLCDYGQRWGIAKTSKQDHERPPATPGAFCREILKILLDRIKGSDRNVHHHVVSIFFSKTLRSDILTKVCGKIKQVLNMIPHSVSTLVGWLVACLLGLFVGCLLSNALLG